MKVIFFLLIGILAASPLIYQQVFATHYTGYNMDDAFYWREFDNDNTNDVWCTFNGIMELPFDDTQISLECKHGSYNGTTNYGALLMMKVFNKTDIQNGALTNVFTWNFDNTCTEATCPYVGVGVLDGAYTYNSLTEPGGFPANIGYVIDVNTSQCTGAVSTDQWSFASNPARCLGNGAFATDVDNIFGAGNLLFTGVENTLFDVPSNTKGTQSITKSITQALWTESTENYFTVFLIMTPTTTATTNHFIQPRYFSITNTDYGTLTWNFPETAQEADDWYDYDGAYTGILNDGYVQNGTMSDHGFFWSFDPDVPAPPTNLFAVVDTSDIDLTWTAPTQTGYTDITGYKIERESPVGGGFATLVANTGDTLVEYSDTSIVVGTVYNYRVSALNTYGSSIPSNESVDGTPSGGDTTDPTPDVTCSTSTTSFVLEAPSVGTETVSLCWSPYDTSPANVTGYQINYTTPWGDPESVVTGLNDTGTTDRTRQITNLQPGTQYSFEVMTWTDSFSNMTNIVNVTTLGDSLNIGDYTFDGRTNPDRLFGFDFVRDDFNATITNLLVYYPDTYNATCNFDYMFAMTNQTYSNLSTTVDDDDTIYANFTLTDSDNDIITVYCEDEITGEDGRYLLTQRTTSMPIFEQVANFRNGTYGTMGFIGVFDVITLGVVIISMIGFNRVNPGVGAIFSGVIIGVAAYFGIVEWYTALTGGIIVVTVLAIMVHNRNDVAD